jgi:lipopolysaccharide/colanic/teichoic acid biosynthesis glycosyltransferase
MTMDGAVPSPFCRRLRARALDELPQLINILRGEMSFVGPRPLIPEELETLEQLPRGADRLLLRPGLTGLAQLHSSKVPALPERLQWDLAYADRCSLFLDLAILLKSVAVTLRGAWEKP